MKPLHIVMLHNRYQFAGGEDASTAADVALLREFGHQVSLIEIHNDQIKAFSRLDKLGLFFTTAWNPKMYRQLRSQLQSLRPDLLHVQNFFPLFSPAVHAAARSLGIPTIQHLHNFRLGCLNSYLLRGNQICEACVGRNPWRGVVHRCYRQSLPASLAVWGMLTFNRWRQTWQREVDAFIVPSQFAAHKLTEIGVPRDRLQVKFSAIADPGSVSQPLPAVPTFLFVGRLSPEKGAMTLLQAWAALAQPSWQLAIVGTGPQEIELKQFVANQHLANVQFHGQRSPEQVISLMRSATAIAIPSQCYETFGRIVVEAFACSRAVLASNLGALSELVQSEQTGFLLPHDQIDAWVERLRWSGEHPTAIATLGNAARQAYEQCYSPAATYQQLIEVYQRVLS